MGIFSSTLKQSWHNHIILKKVTSKKTHIDNNQLYIYFQTKKKLHQHQLLYYINILCFKFVLFTNFKTFEYERTILNIYFPGYS